MQVAWAIEDGKDNPGETQKSPCASFYANLCAFDSDRFQELVKLPPSSPPPPIPDPSTLNELVPVSVFAAGGFDSGEMQGGGTALAACTDDTVETPCVPAERERPVS